MDSTVTIITILILIVFGGVAVISLVNKIKSTKGPNEVKAFLQTIQNKIATHVITWITTTDFTELLKDSKTFAETEFVLTKSIYDEIHQTCLKEFESVYGKDSSYAALYSILNSQMIESFIKQIIESDRVQSMIKSVVESRADNISALELEKQYDDMNKAIENDTYAGKDEVVPEIDPDKSSDNPWPIVPPTEDGDNSDEGTEVIGETKEEQVNLF